LTKKGKKWVLFGGGGDAPPEPPTGDKGRRKVRKPAAGEGAAAGIRRRGGCKKGVHFRQRGGETKIGRGGKTV